MKVDWETLGRVPGLGLANGDDPVKVTLELGLDKAKGTWGKVF